MIERKTNNDKTMEENTFTDKFEKYCGFELQDLFSWNRFVKLMYRPTDPSSLGITRILFGLLMLSDIPEERGGSELDIKWGEPRDCHFPLFNFLKPLPLPYMGLLYGLMWLGAMGVTIGYKFRLSIFAFTIPYWYLFLLDKSYWNNHSYLFGIVSVLLLGSSANYYCSIDGLLDKKIHNKHVPLWNYFILKYQFFLLYFLAGLKKADFEWLEGYSMMRLGGHWVFDPFKIILTTDQIDYLIIHWFGFILDLTVGFWLLYDITRPYAMIFCASFHIMNSRLFSIGMFPYVCLATMPLFCDVNWPRKIYSFITRTKLTQPDISDICIYTINKSNDKKPENDGQNKYRSKDKSHNKLEDKLQDNSEDITQKNSKKDFVDKTKKEILTEPNWKHNLIACLLLTHCGLQIFLPYSHFITKGYNNWTQGLYGYSWDMMVHNWDTVLVVVKVTDNKTGREHFLEPGAWTQNDRWTRHADMSVQYAQCLKKNLMIDLEREIHDQVQKNHEIDLQYITSDNISIYIDVWCSLNKRFQQRMFNPNYDLLKANWSPFKEVEWLIPLLTQYNNFRTTMDKIQKEVYSWSNYSDVLFVADFPGLYLENYITPDMSNITLTVLEGEVFYEIENKRMQQSKGMKLSKGFSVPVKPGKFHKVHTISNIPACYMYTYINITREMNEEEFKAVDPHNLPRSPFPLIEETNTRLDRIMTTLGIIGNSILNIFYNVPMVRRARIY